MYTNEQLNYIVYYLEQTTPTAWATERAFKARDEILMFKTKDEYLAWVAAWKEKYAQTADIIRFHKSQRKQSQPDYDPNAWVTAKSFGRDARAMLFIRECGRGFSWQMKKAAADNAVT